MSAEVLTFTSGCGSKGVQSDLVQGLVVQRAEWFILLVLLCLSEPYCVLVCSVHCKSSLRRSDLPW